MKTSKTTRPFLTFAAGLLFGIFLIGIYSFTIESPDLPNPPDNSQISVDEANSMFFRYYNSSSEINARFKGFSINRDEINAIQALISRDETLDGCRIYLGKNRNNKDVRIVVGVNNNGQDAVASGVYQTQPKNSSPCPTICDGDSPITN